MTFGLVMNDRYIREMAGLMVMGKRVTGWYWEIRGIGEYAYLLSFCLL
jgi:hypothetical protein